MQQKTLYLSVILILLSAASVSRAEEKFDDDATNPTATTKVLQPGDSVQFELQAALINAAPGHIIELKAGTYHFNTELNVACDNITIRGAGRDQTVLSFRNQSAGSSGIIATGNAFVIENLAVEDTVGNAIKVLGAQDVTFRNVRVEWKGGPKSTNGAYGIYPVREPAHGWKSTVRIAPQPTGSARTSGLDLRTVQTDAAKFGVFKSPVAAGSGTGGRRYDIVPGKPDESILMDRLETLATGARMPSLARNMIHEESNRLIREWIRSMPPDPDANREQ